MEALTEDIEAPATGGALAVETTTASSASAKVKAAGDKPKGSTAAGEDGAGDADGGDNDDDVDLDAEDAKKGAAPGEAKKAAADSVTTAFDEMQEKLKADIDKLV